MRVGACGGLVRVVAVVDCGAVGMLCAEVYGCIWCGLVLGCVCD